VRRQIQADDVPELLFELLVMDSLKVRVWCGLSHFETTTAEPNFWKGSPASPYFGNSTVHVPSVAASPW